MTTLLRPDGRTYRPRKSGLWVRAWENDPEEGRGVIVFGTLNPYGIAADRARTACNYWYGDGSTYDITNARPSWWRDTYRWGQRTWFEDGDRGTPGVMYTWEE